MEGLHAILTRAGNQNTFAIIVERLQHAEMEIDVAIAHGQTVCAGPEPWMFTALLVSTEHNSERAGITS